MAASNTYVFFTEVLPRAIKKYGGVDPDALRKAALEVDLPEGGTMLGFGVKFPAEGSPMAGQNERSFPVVIQYVDDKSYVVWPKSQAAARSRAAAAQGIGLQQPVGRGVAQSEGAAVLVVERAGEAFRRLHRRQQRVVQGRSGRDSRPDRPQRLGQEHDLQHAVGHVPADRRDRSRSTGRRSRACRRTRIINRGIGRTFQIPRPFRRLTSSRTWRWPAITARAATARPRPTKRPRRRSPWSACRPTASASVDGLGAAGLKKLELAKALATGPKLLLADESLGGLDETEMDQAADMLRKIRDELGITIIWVEHIMGVLMRVVDRVMVLDHGEKISEGLPSAGVAAIRA